MYSYIKRKEERKMFRNITKNVWKITRERYKCCIIVTLSKEM